MYYPHRSTLYKALHGDLPDLSVLRVTEAYRDFGAAELSNFQTFDFIVPKGNFFFTSQYITYLGCTPTDNRQKQINIYTDLHKHLHRVGLGVIYLGLLLSAVMAAGTRLLP